MRQRDETMMGGAGDRIESEVGPGTQVAQRLALAIHEHRLAPGTKLSEDEVGEAFGVSRTVVRAALQRLAHDRLVTLRRNRGAHVTQLSTREVFEARSLLESRTARSAAERTGEGDLARLQAHIDAEHRARSRGTPTRRPSPRSSASSSRSPHW